MTFRKAIFVITCCGLLIGCEDMPNQLTILEKPILDAVTEEGRGGYNWEITNGQFAIDRPPAFTFATKIDRDKLKQNLELANARTRLESGPIPGMDADVYAWFRRFTEPIEIGQTLMTLEPNANNAARVCSISPNGKLLFVVDSKLKVWEIETKKQREFDSPIPSPIAIHANPANQWLVMCDEKKICRFWFSNGKVETWKLPKGKIVKFAGARDSGHCAVLNDQGMIFRLKPEFTSADKLPLGSMGAESIAISPDGNTILGFESPRVFEWRADHGGSMSEYSMQDLAENTFQPVIGKFQRQWVSENGSFDFPSSTQTPTFGSQHPMRIMRPLILASANASNGTIDWLVVLSEQKDESGQPLFELRDVSFPNNVSSQPYLVGSAAPRSISVSATGTRIAIEEANSAITVIDRQPWVGAAEFYTMGNIAKLTLDGRFEQAELCANTLRKAKLDREYRTGEVLFRSAAFEISRVWSRLAAPPDTPERKALLAKFAKWKEGGSSLAVLSHAYSRAKFRDRLDRSPNTPEFEQNNLAVQQSLLELASRPDAPAGALSLLIDVCTQLHSEFSITEELLARHIENHPEEIDPLVLMCIWLLPSRDGMRGDAHSTLNSIASLYPPEEADKLYAKIALIATEKERGYFDYSTSFDTNRILLGGNLLIEENALRPDLFELLTDMRVSRESVDDVRNLLRIHARRFVMPSHYYYQSNFSREFKLQDIYREFRLQSQ